MHIPRGIFDVCTSSGPLSTTDTDQMTPERLQVYIAGVFTEVKFAIKPENSSACFILTERKRAVLDYTLAVLGHRG